MRGLADEDDLVDKGRDTGADEWAEPVDPVVGPCPADNGGTKGDGGVHGGAVERATGQDVGTHNETNSNGCDYANVTLFRIHCGRVHRVHQPERHHYLEHHRVPRSYSR